MDRAGVWLSQHRRFHASIGTEAGRLRLQAHADIMLSDQPAPQGAACQLIDLRTGALPPTRPISSDQLERGEGMPLAALIFLALEEGTRPDATQVGIVHPDAAHSHLLSAETREAAVPAMTHLAEQQRSLNFGQRGNPPTAEDTPRVTENLPLATVPIEPAVLTAKFEGRATEARGAENGIDGAAWAR
jgi:hypothetical protein